MQEINERVFLYKELMLQSHRLSSYNVFTRVIAAERRNNMLSISSDSNNNAIPHQQSSIYLSAREEIYYQQRNKHSKIECAQSQFINT